ncbi:hypothetical protein NFI96_000282 [Prochilodus magdalenae]|nr:hypothetical protein NFI96_000282 [Prochilodus magdalenae]
MPHIDRAVILEALSVLTGIEVRPRTEHYGWHSEPDELTIENFLPNVYGTECLPSPLSRSSNLDSSFPSLLSELSVVPHPQISAPWRAKVVDLENFLEPRYDYDFSHRSDFSQCSRGGEAYSRPWGWYRIALKVLDKYPDGNAWVLMDGGATLHLVSGQFPSMGLALMEPEASPAPITK